LLFIITTPILCVLLFFDNEFNMFHSPLRFVSGILILGQNLLYFKWALPLLKIDHKYKTVEQKLKWFKLFLFAFIFLWSIQFCSFILIDLFKNTDLCPYTNGMYFITVFFVTYLVMFFLVENNKIQQLKYKNSRLDETNAKLLFHLIQSDFEENKTYRENNISLATLSTKLNRTTKQISQAINSNSQTNFNEFVNSYRLKESRELLLNNPKEKLTVSEIYYLVGFNSKSTFNSLFKKTYGVTPTEFRKKKAV